jgi:hypothetical protein
VAVFVANMIRSLTIKMQLSTYEIERMDVRSRIDDPNSSTFCRTKLDDTSAIPLISL